MQKRLQPCQGRVPPRVHGGSGEPGQRRLSVPERTRGCFCPLLSPALCFPDPLVRQSPVCMRREGRDDFSCHLQPSSPLRQTFPAVRQEAHCPARIPFLMRTSHTRGTASCRRSSLSQGVVPEQRGLSSSRSHHGSGCPLTGARPKPRSRGLTGSQAGPASEAVPPVSGLHLSLPSPHRRGDMPAGRSEPTRRRTFSLWHLAPNMKAPVV